MLLIITLHKNFPLFVCLLVCLFVCLSVPFWLLPPRPPFLLFNCSPYHEAFLTLLPLPSNFFFLVNSPGHQQSPAFLSVCVCLCNRECTPKVRSESKVRVLGEQSTWGYEIVFRWETQYDDEMEIGTIETCRVCMVRIVRSVMLRCGAFLS